eukprot:4249244-Alexandrium_andersonii.AAC.1
MDGGPLSCATCLPPRLPGLPPSSTRLREGLLGPPIFRKCAASTSVRRPSIPPTRWITVACLFCPRFTERGRRSA